MKACAVLPLGHAWPRGCTKDITKSAESLTNYWNVSSLDWTLLFWKRFDSMEGDCEELSEDFKLCMSYLRSLFLHHQSIGWTHGLILQLKQGLHRHGHSRRHLWSTKKIALNTYGSAETRLTPCRGDISAGQMTQQEIPEEAVQVNMKCNCFLLQPGG